jgi:hypothetical protein
MIQGFPADFISDLIYQLGDGRIRRIQLLYMPDEESLEALKDAAAMFGDDDDADGGSWLAPVEALDEDQVSAALEAGGQLLWGYEFDYPQRVIRLWDMRLHDWRANAASGVGYALWFDVAVVSCAAAHGISID